MLSRAADATTQGDHPEQRQDAEQQEGGGETDPGRQQPGDDRAGAQSHYAASVITLRGGVAGLVLFTLASCTWPGPATSTDGPPLSTLAVASVADGDTFTGVDEDGRRVRVRLLGIDAPEVSHDGVEAECGAELAAAALRGLLSGRTVTVTGDPVADPTDRFGRVLGYVTLDGRDVARTLVETGMAAAWYPSGEPRPTRFADYRRAEQAAISAGVGLWSDCPTVGR